MREAKYQKILIDKMQLDGWFVVKLITTNKPGMPDLLCVKGNDVKFIEVKAANGKLSALQEYRISELNKFGVKVEVCYPND